MTASAGNRTTAQVITGVVAAVSAVAGMLSAASVAQAAPRPAALAAPLGPALAVVPSPGQSSAWSTTVDLAPAAVTSAAGTGASGSTDGAGATATFVQPSGLAVAGGKGYTVDSGRIRSVDLTTGAVATLVGNGNTASCTDSATAATVTVGGSAGPAVTDGASLYFEDYCGSSGTTLRKMDLASGATSSIVSHPFSSYQRSVTIGPDGAVYENDGAGGINRVNTATGALTLVASLPNTTGFSAPVVTALAADGTSLWAVARGTCVSGGGANCQGIYKVDPVNGTATPLAGSVMDNLNARPSVAPYGPIVSAGSYLYVPGSSSGSGGELLRFRKSDGAWTAVAGAGTGFLDGTGAQAWFNDIRGLDTDGTSLWVADAGNRRIRKLTPGATLQKVQPGQWSTTLALGPVSVTPFAGDGTAAAADGTGTAAKLANPTGLHIVGGAGYFADGGLIRKVDLSTKAVTTVAGTGTIGCTDNSSSAQAQVQPSGIFDVPMTSDKTFLYFVDGCGNAAGWTKIRRVSLATGAVSTLTQDKQYYPWTYNGLTVGPQGDLFASHGEVIDRINSVTGQITGTITLPMATGHTAYGGGMSWLAADSASLWMLIRRSCPGGNCVDLYKVDPSTGTATEVWVPQSWLALNPMGPILSAGDYLYMPGFSSLEPPYTGLERVSKTTGAVAHVLVGPSGSPLNADGRTLGPGDITGLDVSGSTLYVAAGGAHRIYRLGQAPTVGPVGADSIGGGNPAQITTCKRCAGDPIDLDTGDLFESVTDLSIPGRSVPLAFTRTYDTRMAANAGRLGYGWTDSYDWKLSVDSSNTGTNGQVTIRQDNGSRTVFSPDGKGGYAAPSRVLAALMKNADGTWTYTLRRTLKYRFSSTGQLSSVTDLNGYVTTLTYDASNRLSTVTDPAGRNLTFGYDTVVTTRIRTVTDPLPRTVTFGYDAAGNLSGVTDADGRSWVLGYDTAHRLTSVRDPRLNTVTTEFDPATGRVSRQTDRRGKITQFTYTAPAADGTYTTTVTHPRGNKDVYTYLDGRVVTETRGAGSPEAMSLSYTYDPITNGISSVQDGLGNVSRSTYDAAGNVLTATDALNRTTTWTYNAFNEPLTELDPLGVTTTNTYDSAGNLRTTSRPLVGTTPLQTATATYGYTDASHPGDVTSVTDPLGKVTTFGYDTYGYRNAVTDATGRKTTSTFEKTGWLKTVISPGGNVTGATASAWTTTYSAFTGFGQPKTVTDPLGHITSYSYDANQNLTDVTDAENRKTHTDYDAEDNPTVVTRNDGTTQATGYDDNGNMVSQTDGLLHVTGYGYDALDRENSVTDALNRTTNYGYDAAGNLTTVKQPATGGGVLTTTNGYDAAHQLRTVQYSDGTTPNVTYTYDDDGQRATMLDGTGTTAYTFDSLHRMTKSVNGAGKTVSYGYDLAGRNTTITYPAISTSLPGGVVTNGYDDAGRMTSVKDWANRTTTFRYDGDGRLDLTTWPNAVTGANTLDNADRLTKIAYKKGTTDLGTYTYTYTIADLVASAAPSLTAPGTAETYPYTPNAQLKSKAGAASTAVWGYDAADRITKLPTGATFGYDNADQLTTVTPTTGAASTYTYDPRGNRTSGVTGTATPTTIAYDQANRIKTITTGTAISSYTYDGDGLRARKIPTGGSSQPMVWTVAGGLPLLLSDGIAQYLYGPGGMPIEQIKLAGTTVTPTYLHGDQLSSTVLITTAAGAKGDTYTYDPYGTVTAHTGTTNTNLQFNGQYIDAESGLIYLRARYYHPATGQFLTVDPAATATRARYAYAGGNPLSNTDPTGLDSVTNVGNYLTGLADNISLGIGPWARRQLGVQFDGCDTASYQAGDITGYAFGMIDGETELQAARGARGALRAIGRRFSEIDWASDAGAIGRRLSPNQMNSAIRRGQAPSGIRRVDTGKIPGEQDHVHFSDGSALNRDGTWKHGETTLSRDQIRWLENNGWSLP